MNLSPRAGKSIAFSAPTAEISVFIDPVLSEGTELKKYSFAPDDTLCSYQNLLVISAFIKAETDPPVLKAVVGKRRSPAIAEGAAGIILRDIPPHSLSGVVFLIL